MPLRGSAWGLLENRFVVFQWEALDLNDHAPNVLGNDFGFHDCS